MLRRRSLVTRRPFLQTPDASNQQPIVVEGLASGVTATSLTATPNGAAAPTFAVNGSTKVTTAVTSLALANGDRVIVSAAASAPTGATSIVIIPAGRGF
jgi:hypothetical protein